MALEQWASAKLCSAVQGMELLIFGTAAIRLGISPQSFCVFFFSSPNLSGHRLDIYHTSTHGVALVRILKRAARG